jgi:hypothetical protein
MRLNTSSPGNFSPGNSFIVYVNMSYQSNDSFNMDISAFIFSVSANNTINCSSSLSNATAGNAGNYTSTCTVNSTAVAGTYTLTGIYPNAKAK